MDFILFNASLGGYSYSQRKENPSKEQVACLLADARAVCLAGMFDCAPIRVAEIKQLASQPPKPSSLSDVAAYFESVKPSQLEEKLRPLVTMPLKTGEELAKAKGDPVDFAFSAFTHFLLERLKPIQLPQACASPNEVRLAANYDGWVAIKKCDVAKSEPKEVMASLASIYATVSKKLPEYASTNFQALNSLSDGLFKNYPERKSYARVPLLLRDVDKILQEAEKLFTPGFESQAASFLLDAGLERCGFPPFITIDAINGNYPELKIPKPKGNYGPKKK